MDKSNFIDANDLAETYWNVHCQNKSSWTQELDVRRLGAKW